MASIFEVIISSGSSTESTWNFIPPGLRTMIVRESGAAAFVSKRITEGAAINSAGRRIKASTERLFFTPPLSIWIWILSFCCPGKRFATGFARRVKPSPSFSGVEEISSFPSVVLASRKTSGSSPDHGSSLRQKPPSIWGFSEASSSVAGSRFPIRPRLGARVEMACRRGRLFRDKRFFPPDLFVPARRRLPGSQASHRVKEFCSIKENSCSHRARGFFGSAIRHRQRFGFGKCARRAWHHPPFRIHKLAPDIPAWVSASREDSKLEGRQPSRCKKRVCDS